MMEEMDDDGEEESSNGHVIRSEVIVDNGDIEGKLQVSVRRYIFMQINIH